MLSSPKDTYFKTPQNLGRRRNTEDALTVTHLHLLIPTLDEPANHGSRINMHLKVTAFLRPARREGLSWRRRPFLNQCTKCFGLDLLLTSPVIMLFLMCCPEAKLDYLCTCSTAKNFQIQTPSDTHLVLPLTELRGFSMPPTTWLNSYHTSPFFQQFTF